MVIQEGSGTEQLRTALAEWIPVRNNGALSGPAGEGVKAALAACSAAAGETAGSNALKFLQVRCCLGGGWEGGVWRVWQSIQE